MTTRRLSPCAACGRMCVAELCRPCIRSGYHAVRLWCDCDYPAPDMNGVCAGCGRLLEGGA